MRIDREQAKQAFASYVERYDSSDSKVRLKIEHTARVSEICEKIAVSIGMSQEDVDLAWLIGLLHDVGRFEQLRRFGTFIDSESIDHANFGADILFDKAGEIPLIRNYLEDTAEDTLIEIAVRNHSAYRIQEGLTQREQMYCHILRDADKIDIMKVNIDFPLEEIYNVTTEELLQAEVSPEVMDSFSERHATLRSIKKTCVDHVVGHISLAFELVYPLSLQMVKDQGYLERLLYFQSENPVTQKQFAILREQMNRYMKEKLG